MARLARQCAAAHAKVLRPHEALEDELAEASEPVSEVDRARIRSALTQLSIQDTQLLILRYEFGWSIAVIAEALGVSVTTVKVGSFRARKRLRSALLDPLGSRKNIL